MNSIFAERKILRHIDTLNKYIKGEEFPPILVEIDLTNKCTSDCKWCFGFVDRKWRDDTLFEKQTEDSDERKQSSIDGVNGLLEDLARLGVKAITWTGGGDPTCHKGLFGFLKKSSELGITNGLITNGVVNVKDALPYCQWIRFSVDGATKETYGSQHGKPQHFDLVVANVREAAAYKLANGYTTTLGVAFVTHSETKAEIISFAEMWKNVAGIDYIQYRPLLDKYGEKWFSDTKETIELIKSAKEIEPRVTFSEPKYNALLDGKTGKTKLCHGTYFEVAIAADGKVYVCCHMKGKPQYAIGNLYEENIADIWARHQKEKEFRVNKDCPAFCRHYGTNLFIEDEILKPRDHENFI